MKFALIIGPFVLALAAVLQPPARDAAQSAASETGRITGRVVSETGEPVRLARVTLQSLTSPPPIVRFSGPAADASLLGLLPSYEPPETFTDANGRFIADGLSAGRYRIAVRKPGFVTTSYGARRPGEPPVDVVLDAGAREDVMVRMPRAAAIAGRIIDQFGEPIEGMLVTVEQLVRSEGFVSARSVGTMTKLTNDLGEYRVGGLGAGRYVVNVWRTNANVAPMAIARTYFPGVIGLSRAQPIELSAGEQHTSTDFVALPETALATLTVRFVDADGKAVSGTASLASVGTPIPEFTTLPNQAEQVSGHVEPGTWMLVGRGSDGVAAAEISIGSSDTSATLTLGKGGSIAGVIEADGELPAGVRFSVAEGRPNEIAPNRVRATALTPPAGTFRLTGLIGPTVFRVGPNLPRGWAVKGIFAGDRDLTDVPVDFRTGVDIGGARVVLTTRTAALSGTAVDAQGAVRVDCSILVFPEDRALAARPRRYARWVRPDQRAAFSIEDLLPGAYLAVAVDDVDDTQWMNADYLDRFRALAAHVTLAESDRKTITLRMATP
ncbi:MAG TPA: carboxypeptidase-like regulatory domain-containing protein [Vicinamibacterales bacterium]|nr:carboxypeptidase-like regulatory domain-containing protein [Vicinamibacterales bacterium]